MKLSKLKLITACVIMSSVLIFTPACNNNKESEKNSKTNENNATTGDTTTAQPTRGICL